MVAKGAMVTLLGENEKPSLKRAPTHNYTDPVHPFQAYISFMRGRSMFDHLTATGSLIQCPDPV